jgi:hypothetical protein
MRLFGEIQAAAAGHYYMGCCCMLLLLSPRRRFGAHCRTREMGLWWVVQRASERRGSIRPLFWDIRAAEETLQCASAALKH